MSLIALSLIGSRILSHGHAEGTDAMWPVSAGAVVSGRSDAGRLAPLSTESIPSLAKHKTVLLTTFRRDGRTVGTPVHVAVEEGHAYFRSFDAAGKVKRIRHTPAVEIAPCTMRGTPTGPVLRAQVRLLDGEGARRAARALARRFPFLHGMLVPWAHRLKGYRTLHFELLPPDLPT